MKKSISVATFPTEFGPLVFTGNLKDTIEKVANLGYDGIELFVKRPEEIKIDSLRQWIRFYDIDVSAIAAVAAFVEDGLSLSDPAREIRKRHVEIMKRQIELASHFDAVVPVGLVRGRIKEGFSLDDAEKWFAESLIECEKVAKNFNVIMALEPLNRYETNFINTLKEGIRFIRKVGLQNVKILADTFHMNIEETSISESIIAARDYLFHIHLADSNRYAPGDGHLNFEEIMEALRRIRYDRFIAMEILPEPDPLTAARHAINYIKKLDLDSKS